MAAKPPEEWNEPDVNERPPELYVRFGPVLLARLFGFCNNRDSALEAMQEAFARYVRCVNSGPPIRQPEKWLYQVGCNILRDEKRRQAPVEFIDQVDGREEPGETAALAKETRSLIHQALDRLSIEHRELFALRYGLGWPSERIAETLGLTPPAVDMALHRARKRLADLLQAAGVNHEQP